MNFNQGITLRPVTDSYEPTWGPQRKRKREQILDAPPPLEGTTNEDWVDSKRQRINMEGDTIAFIIQPDIMSEEEAVHQRQAMLRDNMMSTLEQAWGDFVDEDFSSTQLYRNAAMELVEQYSAGLASSGHYRSTSTLVVEEMQAHMEYVLAICLQQAQEVSELEAKIKSMREGRGIFAALGSAFERLRLALSFSG